MNELTNVAVICGGKSSEHQVSLISAKNIISQLDPNKYRVITIAVEHDGTWRFSQNDEWLIGQNVNDAKINSDKPEVDLIKGGHLIEKKTARLVEKIDVAFPIIHGTTGEDGILQGFLQFLEVPFVGSQVLGSAITNDKEITKRILRDNNLPIVPFLSLKLGKTLSFQHAVKKLESEILFVKPCHLGSSVGVSKVSNPNEFEDALQMAFQYDKKIMIEPFIEGREMECAVLGTNHPKASDVIGEVIVPQNQFYSYENKYIESSDIIIDADLPEDLLQKIRQCAVSAFQCLECQALARVDFFIKPNHSFFINEINTLPGFTEISMYPKLWQASGLPYSKLLDQLIELARQA